MTLKGFLQSGTLFIGDPQYMSGDQRNGELPPDPHNPFLDWDKFTHSLDGKDAALGFPGAIEANSSGRGVVVQIGQLNGQYEICKDYDENGRLFQLRVVIKD